MGLRTIYPGMIVPRPDYAESFSCACGHQRSKHQFQGLSANWPCGGKTGDDSCGCNWFSPIDNHDPYLIEYLRLYHFQDIKTGKKFRVDPNRHRILWVPGQLERHKQLLLWAYYQRPPASRDAYDRLHLEIAGYLT